MNNKNEKGFVLIMAMLFIFVISGVLTTVLMRQAGQSVETENINRQKSISQCAELSFEVVQASIYQLNVQNAFTVTIPGLTIRSGHFDDSTAQPFPIANNASIGSSSKFDVCAANSSCDWGGGGGAGIPLTPTVTCQLTNGGIVEIELGIRYLLP